MSQQGTAVRDADQHAADAVVAHHAEMRERLAELVAHLLLAAERDDEPGVWRTRADLVAWIDDELMPHAQAEETTLYSAAVVTPEGNLLVEAMLDEHRAIGALAQELEGAAVAIQAAATARALEALFAVHLAKENDLIIPLLLRTPDVSLAHLLHGMRQVLGEPDEPGDRT
ncbi:hemerythrin domain-containing protein [Pilimelia columellifera]|uniref:Hemerythrin-like domain-containing protein n=1 Tax=Pilimelia columellifera subsp. columellifera TaxID=706583 RepID=A0ABP6AWC2_9ACTN